MFIIRLRNLLVHWHDPVADARVYLEPVGQVYPPAGDEVNPFNVTGPNGEVEYDLTDFPPKEYTLWIVPKDTTTAPVGPWTAISSTAARIYRGLRVQFEVGGHNKVTQARVHFSTQDNGQVGALASMGKNQELDVFLRPIWIKSPYHAGRNNTPVDMIIVHKTGGPVIGPTINQFLFGGTSAHYVIDRNGQIVKLVLETQAAGHASHEDKNDQSHWGTQTNLNFRSIGIENVGTDEQGLESAQYQSLIRLIQDLMREFNVPRHRVIGHSDVLTDGHGALSKRRIACPGFQFDWPQLENAPGQGIGLQRTGGSAASNDAVAAFFDAMQQAGVPDLQLQEGDYDVKKVGAKVRAGKFGGKERPEVDGAPIAQLQQWLAEIGYSVGPANGQYSHRTARAVLHFQTHFVGPGANPNVNRQTAALIRAVWQANPHAP
jgi:N-acetyl-anhydromuramyl-L-alanine amidase AmpD